ncbi:P-loop containing nucleoside triphosphate hydrolase protein [Pelagophyceae sp. CCMP2097]|nr:P-loop containing nucleoside triphosphate hydrolase protein [Pelagophyceae sp. CCMP2097]
MGLSPPLLKGVLTMGYKQPTPVQRQVLPEALAGKDVACMARTGSGKTAAFLIPMLENIMAKHVISGDVVAIVLSPTRELALQTFKFSQRMAKFAPTRIVQASLVGGESVEEQFNTLAKRPAAIIATPGRLAHLLEEVPKSLLTLAHARMAVFDEADRLFEMGFAEQLRSLLHAMASERQTLLFSATMPRALAQFARAGLRDNCEIIRLESEAKLSDTLRLAFFVTRSNEKPAALCAVLRKVLDDPKEMTIIFVATRHHCELLLAIAEATFPERKATCIYGAMDQEARTKNLHAFRTGATPLLIVTDVAARGLDVPMVDHVVNYSFPSAARLFVHRAGRAARQGRPGVAISLVEPDELAYMIELHDLVGKVAADPSTSERRFYTRKTGWTMADVHYGRVPQAALDMEIDNLAAAAVTDDGTIRNMTRVCENAMQAYRRTRPQPHKTAIKRAKELPLGLPHPLFVSADSDAAQELQKNADLSEAQALRDRLHAYRPPSNILEFATAAGKNGFEAAGAMSRAVRGFKRKADFAAAMAEIPTLPAPEENDASDDEDEDEDSPAAFTASSRNVVLGLFGDPSAEEAPAVDRKRLSKADRKRQKTGAAAAPVEPKDEAKDAVTFKDSTHYIEYNATNFGEMEEVLGHRRDRGDDAVGNASARLEAAMLDVTPDEALEMAKKKRMFKWDARKRKYVQQTVAELTDKARGNRKIRTESGKMVNKDDATSTAGDMYRKWAERTKRPAGDMDAGEADDGGVEVQGKEKKADYRARKTFGAPPKKKRKVRAPGDASAKGAKPAAARDEVKTPEQIAKARAAAANMKLKNMPKDKRRVLTAKLNRGDDDDRGSKGGKGKGSSKGGAKGGSKGGGGGAKKGAGGRGGGGKSGGGKSGGGRGGGKGGRGGGKGGRGGGKKGK